MDKQAHTEQSEKVNLDDLVRKQLADLQKQESEVLKECRKVENRIRNGARYTSHRFKA